jgi:hypothetical protein
MKMVIEGISSARPGLFPDLLRVRDANDRLTAPVRPAQTVFAQFKHIRSVPSSDGAVSLFKLRVLDNLIDRLLAEGVEVPAGLDGSGPDAGRIDSLDSLMEGMQRDLRERVLRLPTPFGGAFSGRGTLIDLVA